PGWASNSTKTSSSITASDDRWPATARTIAKFSYVFSKDCSARSRQRGLRNCGGLDTARLRSTALLAHGIDIASNRQARRYRAGGEWRDEVRHALLRELPSRARSEWG